MFSQWNSNFLLFPTHRRNRSTYEHFFPWMAVREGKRKVIQLVEMLLKMSDDPKLLLLLLLLELKVLAIELEKCLE